MTDKLRNIQWSTALVMAVGIVGVCFLAYFAIPVDVIAGYAAAFIGIAGVAKGLLEGKSE